MRFTFCDITLASFIMKELPLGFGPHVRQAGDATLVTRKGQRLIGHLPFYRLISLLDGNLSVMDQGKQMVLQPGMVFLQQPGQEYEFGLIGNKHWCFVTFNVVWNSLNDPHRRAQNPQPHPLPSGETSGQAFFQTMFMITPCVTCDALPICTGAALLRCKQQTHTSVCCSHI